MKKRSKKISFMLAVVLVFALLVTGCVTKNDPGETADSPAATSDDGSGTPAESTAPELEEYVIEITLPGAEQKDIQLIQDEINKITKEKINATVNFTVISFASWAQQTNLMIASDEKSDLMWTASFFNYSDNVAKGQFMPLDDLLAQYGGNIQSVLGDTVLDGARVDGSIYGIPSVRDFAADNGFIMRKDIVDKYNIDVDSIQTLDDMTDVFKTVKENETDLIPFTTTQTVTIAELIGSGTYDKLDNWMGVTALGNTDLQIVDYYETQLYADILSTVRSWYEAGYISKDASTSKETPDSLVKADKTFSYAYAGKPGIAAQESKKTGKEMVYVPITSPVSTTSSITAGMMSIPITSDNPERAMMLLDLWYSDADLVNLFDNGIEGVHYVIGEDNQLTFPEGIDASTTTYTPINYRIGDNFMAYIWQGDAPDLWEQMDQFNKGAINSPALGFTFNSASVKTEVAAVSSVVSQYRMGLDTGTLDPETALPEYISKLKAAGIDKIIAEKQAQIDEWKANN